MTINQITCPNCQGSCKIYLKSNCEECTNGKKNEELVVNIDVPVNVDNGKQYVFNEWGEQPKRDTDIPGDFVIVVMIETDPNFTRNGLDLIYTQSITLRESIVGKKITIPHFKEPIELELSGFGIINPNKRYTLYEKGMPGGHLHIIFKIEYPEKVLSEETKIKLNELLQEIEK